MSILKKLNMGLLAGLLLTSVFLSCEGDAVGAAPEAPETDVEDPRVSDPASGQSGSGCYDSEYGACYSAAELTESDCVELEAEYVASCPTDYTESCSIEGVDVYLYPGALYNCELLQELSEMDEEDFADYTEEGFTQEDFTQEESITVDSSL